MLEDLASLSGTFFAAPECGNSMAGGAEIARLTSARPPQCISTFVSIHCAGAYVTHDVLRRLIRKRWRSFFVCRPHKHFSFCKLFVYFVQCAFFDIRS